MDQQKAIDWLSERDTNLTREWLQDAGILWPEGDHLKEQDDEEQPAA